MNFIHFAAAGMRLRAEMRVSYALTNARLRSTPSAIPLNHLARLWYDAGEQGKFLLIMGELEIAKEITRIGRAAGLSKDVIDLIERKSLLLAERVELLERENAVLSDQVAQLRRCLLPPGFVESDGLLWKRVDSGYESYPYCPVCTGAIHPIHPVVMDLGLEGNWVCPANHTFSYNRKPPVNHGDDDQLYETGLQRS